MFVEHFRFFWVMIKESGRFYMNSMKNRRKVLSVLKLVSL